MRIYAAMRTKACGRSGNTLRARNMRWRVEGFSVEVFSPVSPERRLSFRSDGTPNGIRSGATMILTVREAAKLLGMTERVIYRRIAEQSIPVHRINDQHRFNRAELLEWATAHGLRVSVSDFSGPDSVSPSPSGALHLAEALSRGGVHEHVEGSDRNSVLRAVVKRMPVADEDRELLFDVFVAREALGSTGVGDGIAIPHVRSPIVLHLAEPAITLSYLEHPVDFGAIDGKDVHTIFSIVTPTTRAHLHVLSRLAAALHDKAFRAAVMGRAPAEEILREARRVEATFSEPLPSSNGPP